MFPVLKTKVSENDKVLFNFSRCIYQNEIYNFPTIKKSSDCFGSDMVYFYC